MCKSLTLSWAEFCRLFHKSLSKPPKQYKKNKNGNVCQFTFGCETFKIANSVYCHSHLNHLLQICLFGHNFQILNDSDIIYRSKKYVVIHLHSLARIQQLLSLEGLCRAKEKISGDSGIEEHGC